MDLVECQFEEPIQQRVHVFGTKAFGNRGRVRQVTEQHRHLFPFTFQSTPGGQNFFGKVFGCVGQGFSFVVCGDEEGLVLEKKVRRRLDWGLSPTHTRTRFSSSTASFLA